MVDVFSQQAFSGNPLAVIFDADDLDTAQMQHITRWMNLSETVFFQSPTHPDADYKVRIFTLTEELPFAGHPTLGSCHAWLKNGGKQKHPDFITQECGAGLIKIKRDQQKLSFAAPQLIRFGDVSDDDTNMITRILGIHRDEIKQSRWIDNGPGWVGVLLDSADKVLNLKPKSNPDDSFDIGIVGAYPKGSECDFELRALFNDQNGTLREDPVTGSLNASVAQWLFESELAPNHYIASQGTCMQRTGRVYLEKDANGDVWVGGYCHSRVTGKIDVLVHLETMLEILNDNQ